MIDLLLVNGTIITMNAKRNVIYGGAVAVSKYFWGSTRAYVDEKRFDEADYVFAISEEEHT